MLIHKPNRRRARFLPQIEELEGRWCPAASWGTDLMSSAGSVSVLASVNDSPGQLAADPWPMFQGDASHSGIGPAALPTQTPELLRRTAVDFEGSPGILVIGPDGTVYVPSSYIDENEMWRGRLHAFKPDGSQWSVNLDGPPKLTAPAVANNGVIYLHTSAGVSSRDNVIGAQEHVYAIRDLGSVGQIDWVGEFSLGTFPDVHSSPVIGADGTIYVASSNTHLYALNSDGSVKWRVSPDRSSITSSPALGPNGWVYLGRNVYTPEGQEIRRHGSGLAGMMSSVAVGRDASVYYYHGISKVLRAYNPDGTQRWEHLFDRIEYGDTTPALSPDGQTVYLGREGLLAFDASNGTLRWSHAGSGTGSPLVGTNGVVLWNSDSILHATDAAGTVLWELPSVSGDALGDDGTIYHLNATITPTTTTWSLDVFQADVDSPPTVPVDRVVVTAPDEGASPVQVFDALTGVLIVSFEPFNAGRLGGVQVTLGDVNGDRLPDLVTAARTGQVEGTAIKVFDGAALLAGLVTELCHFQPYASARDEVFVALGDFNGDGRSDLVTGNVPRKGPTVKVFSVSSLLNGAAAEELGSVQPFGRTYRGGARVATGDVNGDGTTDLIAGQSKKGAQVVVISGVDFQTVLVRRSVASTAIQGGVFVTAGDSDGDAHSDIIIGLGIDGKNIVKVYEDSSASDARARLLLHRTQIANSGVRGGVRVATVDLTGDGRLDVVALAEPGDSPSRLGVLDGTTLMPLDAFLAQSPDFTVTQSLAAARID